MPILDCSVNKTIQSLNKPPNCLKKVYVANLAIGRWSEIEMVGVTSDQISAFTMIAGKTFMPITVGRRSAKISWEYTEDSGLYAIVLEIDLGGFDNANRKAILEMQSFCDLVVYASLSDCNMMLLGLDKIDGKYDIFDENKMTGHSASLGGDDDGNNILTFTFNTLSAPEYTTSDFDIPLPA